MTRNRVSVACLTSVLALGPGAALAAAPKAGGVYVGGVKPANHVPKRVVLTVSRNGRTAKGIYYCGTGRSADRTLPRMTITRGSFHAASKTGALTLWSLSGRFVSRTRARVRLRLSATCDGGDYRFALDLKKK